jgi:HD-like signal output (HDOD) protein
VLSVANSAVFRGVTEVETVREAVTRLGLQEVGRVAAAVAARTLFNPHVREERAAFSRRSTALFTRSVAVGSAAASVAMRHPGARSDRVYLGGLLHDVGKGLALRALARLVLDGGEPEPDPSRLERVLERVHVEIGDQAIKAWALPTYLALICSRHHDEVVPSDAEFLELHLVRLASAVAALREPTFSARAAREIVQSSAALRLDAYEVRALRAELRQAEERAAALPR